MEREHGIELAGFPRWHAKIQGTLADVDRFNREVVGAIRGVDADTPILLDGGFDASPFGLTNLTTVDDPAVLYGFHYYEPWEYVTYRVNEGRYRYPDTMPGDWTPSSRREALASVAAWAGQRHIDPRRIVLLEFGCDRRVEGAAEYLDDLLDDAARWDWHWAFYAYRGDGSWGGLDYELGTEPFDGAYWAAVEQGVDPETLKRREPNPLWDVLARRLEDPCRGAALDLATIREQDLCRIHFRAVGSFPGSDLLAAEIGDVTVAGGDEVRFPVVYTNSTAESLRVDLYLLEGEPAIEPTRLMRDGIAVEPPASCLVSELVLAEGRRVTLSPGGSLRMEARFVARPGGSAVWPGLGSSCDAALAPGEYTLEVRAPSAETSRIDSARLTVTR